MTTPTRALPPGQNTTVLGLDVGGSKTRLILGSLAGRVHLWHEFATPADRPFEVWFTEMARAAQTVLADGQAQSLPAPVAISVAVGGPLDIEAGVIYSPPHLPTWSAIPLKERLAAHFGLPAWVEHDGNAGALAEFYNGAGQSAHSLIFLTLGTGLGAGIIFNGQVLRGVTDTAGEVGHTRVAPDGPLVYGKAGAWEGYCSAAGLEQLAQVRAPQAFPAPASARQIVQAALNGEPAAVRLVEEMGEWLGQGLANLIDTLNPQLIIVGTLAVVLGELLLAPARAVVAREALPVAARACQIVPAALGAELGNVAALMAASHAWRQGLLAVTVGRGELDSLVIASLQASLVTRQTTVANVGRVIADSAQAILTALQGGGKVLTCGNGGSAAAAAHLSGELMGRFRADRQPLPAVNLAADGALLTCIANDYSFEEVFARQVEALAGPGDVVVAFTTSGRSPNVLRALAAANGRGALTIALTGRQGLAAPGVADHIISIDSDSTARIQEEHEVVIHIWCEAIDRAFA